MTKAVVILITGHPATGKTTVAHYLAEELRLPLIWKDQIKETLFDLLGTSTAERSRQLGVVAWALLYHQVENLLRAGVSHLVESNFDPYYANEHWQNLAEKYDFRMIQVRCETEPETLLKRYRRRIETGDRHPGHWDASAEKHFIESVQRSMGWVVVDGDRLSIDTTAVKEADYAALAQKIRKLIERRSP